MERKQKYILLLIVTVVCGIIVFWQYSARKSRFERLLNSGKTAELVAEQYNSAGVNYAHYYFITDKGQKIKGSTKCGNSFHNYVNASARYNTNKPHEYELSFELNHYSNGFSIFFFFFIYLPAMVFVMYRLTKLVLAIRVMFRR